MPKNSQATESTRTRKKIRGFRLKLKNWRDKLRAMKEAFLNLNARSIWLHLSDSPLPALREASALYTESSDIGCDLLASQLAMAALTSIGFSHAFPAPRHGIGQDYLLRWSFASSAILASPEAHRSIKNFPPFTFSEFCSYGSYGCCGSSWLKIHMVRRFQFQLTEDFSFEAVSVPVDWRFVFWSGFCSGSLKIMQNTHNGQNFKIYLPAQSRGNIIWISRKRSAILDFHFISSKGERIRFERAFHSPDPGIQVSSLRIRSLSQMSECFTSTFST
jgi:hypothetical protein